MKYVLVMIAALALSVPAFAQETESSPDARKVRIQIKDGSVIIKDGEEADEADLPEEVQEMLKRFREQMEEMRKDMEERMKKVREEFEKQRESEDSSEGKDGEEVEEHEYKSPDGKTHVKIKIVRIRKTSSSEGEAPKAPEEAKKETERKQ